MIARLILRICLYLAHREYTKIYTQWVYEERPHSHVVAAGSRVRALEDRLGIEA